MATAAGPPGSVSESPAGAPSDQQLENGANGGPPAAGGQSFASGARVLSIGIASTGIFTFAYLATASHVLNSQAYGRVSLCWAVMFVILSVIYRPVSNCSRARSPTAARAGCTDTRCGSRP